MIACKADFTVFSNSLKANLSLSPLPPFFFPFVIIRGKLSLICARPDLFGVPE